VANIHIPSLKNIVGKKIENRKSINMDPKFFVTNMRCNCSSDLLLVLNSCGA
jgi:hypothetical protein